MTSEMNGLSDGESQALRDNSEAGEALLNSIKPAAAGDSIASKLQSLSPDKPVLDLSTLKDLDSNTLSLFKANLEQQAALWTKVTEPIRNVYNTTKRQEMTGGEDPEARERSEKYTASVQKVLRENMQDLANEAPFRAALPIQVKGETFWAFSPPLQTNICEGCIIFPLHSADPGREAQLRKQGANFANSVSSYEMVFRYKVAQVGPEGESLLPRKPRPA